jgi:hypothetical protein
MSRPWENARPEDWERLRRQVIDKPPGDGGGGVKQGGPCLLVLVGMVSASWLLDLLLAGSRAVT